MKAAGEVGTNRRRSWAEASQLVVEFERSGLRRKEFCAARGLSVHTLDAWRRRAARSVGVEKIVPVELVESCDRGPKLFLGNFESFLQTDGYKAYDKVGGEQIVHAVCWSHARRNFSTNFARNC